MQILKSGDIIKFNIINRKYAPDGFAMGGVWGCNDEELIIFQTIDIELFPSCRDFQGNTTKIKHGSFGMVVRKIGKPWKIHQLHEDTSYYEVYEILTAKFTKRQVFKYNMEKVF